MKPTLFLSLLFICLLTVSSFSLDTKFKSEPDIDLEYERAELIRTDRDFSSYSQVNGPANAFREFLMEDALMLPAGALPVYGRENIYSMIKANGRNYSLIWEPRGCEISSAADMGYTWGIFIASLKSEGKPTKSYKGKYLNVWQKDEDGNWRVKVDAGNSNPKEES